MQKKLFCDAEIGKIYKILEIKTEDKKLKNRLKNLGFVEGEKIQLLKHNYKKFGCMVKVMGVNFVIDKKVSEIIFVYEL